MKAADGWNEFHKAILEEHPNATAQQIECVKRAFYVGVATGIAVTVMKSEELLGKVFDEVKGEVEEYGDANGGQLIPELTIEA